MEYPLLEKIEQGLPLSSLAEGELDGLCTEIRGKIIETVLSNGGHLASSLGAVEAIVACERVFDLNHDRIVFDVGHQAYAHKLLTGRFSGFSTLRTEGGISGFPKRQESPYDFFGTGHASTSISAALGMARAMHLNGEQGTCVAFIGDASLGGGEAFEALNDAGNTDLPLVVVLNDNDMSISRPRGALRQSLQEMRVSRKYLSLKRRIVSTLDHGVTGRFLSRHMKDMKDRIRKFLIPDQLFEQFGFIYLGPIDGHDIAKLEDVLNKAKQAGKPVIVHVNTQKGRGYLPAQVDPEHFHGISPASATGNGQASCSHVFGETLCALARQDARITAVTAAMSAGTGLSGFSKEFPDRFFDVGIAEEHAVTMSAGMAAEGMRPVVAIYSTFLQRAYDQVLHDICLQRLPVILAVDRAGLTGEDGETHQGIYDLAYLATAPGMDIYVPSTPGELQDMLKMALDRLEPAAIRYPRGSLPERNAAQLVYGRWETVLPPGDVTVIACGTMVSEAYEACRKTGAGLVNARFPLMEDAEILREIAGTSRHVITVEDGIPCLGLAVSRSLHDMDVRILAVRNEPVAHASVARQRARYGIDQASILDAISSMGGKA